MTPARKAVLGFLTIILIGTCLLMLPFASRQGQSTSLVGAMMTSVSATCVTGLVAYDTWTHWTLFGQLVILTEIQIGGLGFITIGTFMLLHTRRKIMISDRAMIHESLSTLHLRGGAVLVRRIIRGTAVIELLGTALLAVRFVPALGVRRGLYYALFHAVSAFCNGGFDLMGYGGEYSSLTSFATDPLVIPVVSALIIIGGIGFVVWEDIYVYKWHFRKYHFHSKLVLFTTFELLLIGTLLFYLMERDQLFAAYDTQGKWLAAFFSAVTPRTAGFNSVDTASLSDGGLVLTMILMMIGGSPGSTAGGIKTTTFLILLLYLKAYLFREKDCVIFKMRIAAEDVQKACVVFLINLFLAVAGLLFILAVQPLALRDVMFEVFSAIGTAGMSTGVTRSLNTASQIVIMLLMFSGRMGTLTFAMSFTENRKIGKIRYSTENLPIG